MVNSDAECEAYMELLTDVFLDSPGNFHLFKKEIIFFQGPSRPWSYAISAYHHWCCEFESRSGRGVQHYVIKFVSDLRQVGGFLRVLESYTNNTDRHDITEILLKVALNTIKQTTMHKSIDAGGNKCTILSCIF